MFRDSSKSGRTRTHRALFINFGELSSSFTRTTHQPALCNVPRQSRYGGLIRDASLLQWRARESAALCPTRYTSCVSALIIVTQPAASLRWPGMDREIGFLFFFPFFFWILIDGTIQAGMGINGLLQGLGQAPGYGLHLLMMRWAVCLCRPIWFCFPSSGRCLVGGSRRCDKCTCSIWMNMFLSREFTNISLPQRHS